MTLVNFYTIKIIPHFSKNQEIELQLVIGAVFNVVENSKYFILNDIF